MLTKNTMIRTRVYWEELKRELMDIYYKDGCTHIKILWAVDAIDDLLCKKGTDFPAGFFVYLRSRCREAFKTQAYVNIYYTLINVY